MADQVSGVGLSGANSSLNFAIEKYASVSGGVPTWHGTFNSGITGTPTPFFIGGKLTSMERNNNLELVYGFGSREAQWIVAKQFTGSFTVEGLLSSPWAFISVFGGYSYSGTTAITHVFTPVTGVSSLSVHNYIDMTSEPVTSGQETHDASRIVDYKLTGCICTSCNVSASVGEIATVKMDFAYATENQDTNNTSMTNEVPWTGSNAFSPFTFANGYVKWNGNKLAEVQSCDITISPNNEMVYGFGSRMASSAIGKQYEYDINLTIIFEDPFVLMDYIYSGAAVTETDGSTLAPNACVNAGITLVLFFDNSACGYTNTQANYRSMSFDFTGCALNTDSLPQSPNEMIVETANIKAKGCTLTCINGIATVQGLPT